MYMILYINLYIKIYIMLNSIMQAKEISLTDFRKVISETLNSNEVQVVYVKKGKK